MVSCPCPCRCCPLVSAFVGGGRNYDAKINTKRNNYISGHRNTIYCPTHHWTIQTTSRPAHHPAGGQGISPALGCICSRRRHRRACRSVGNGLGGGGRELSQKPRTTEYVHQSLVDLRRRRRHTTLERCRTRVGHSVAAEKCSCRVPDKILLLKVNK